MKIKLFKILSICFVLLAISSCTFEPIVSDFCVHNYTEWLTIIDSTCEKAGIEQRYCTHCGDTRSRELVKKECVYSGVSCINCKKEHPNLKKYAGKTISILGDSISTFAGYIPIADGFNLEHVARYPQDNLFTDVKHTWWMQVLSKLNAKLAINDSWRSTEVYNSIDLEVNGSYDGTKACMASTTRIQNLGSNGTPDIILFYGGTNDILQRRPIGTFNPETAPIEVDLLSVKWETVADAYVSAIMRIQYYYPNTKIVAMLPTYTSSNTNDVIEKYNSVFAKICENYGVTSIDLRSCGITTENLPDGIHPDEIGMDYITKAVLDELLKNCTFVEGEHVVHKVTHNLSGVKSSLGYYKGVSHGSSFVTNLAGTDFDVNVTMAGIDITANSYKNGQISIDKVIGDIVITAVGTVKSIYDEYLQILPENLCSKINIWSILKPVSSYYTASGWGSNATGAYSVTIQILANEKIWATSFQKAGINGGGSNGIRITWFNLTGVIKTMSPSETYAEFSTNGYLTAPDGAVAVNIVMWNGKEDNEIYLLNRIHNYQNGKCSFCGMEE